jgi:Ca2+-transporting ATPase
MHAVAALRSLSAPTARVRRGGQELEMPASDLVPGDILLVKEGDVVGADARLLADHDLEVDEALLTGESVPSVRRSGPPVAEGAPLGDRVTMLHAGTTVARGRGEAVVVATGSSSQVGQLAGLLSDRSAPVTPLQRRLRRLGQQLSAVVVAACVVVAVTGLIRGQDVEIMALTGISLAVAAIPESLPAVVALALAGGAHRMARRGAIVRSLPAVETLGSVTLLATDKTGTLTKGAMDCVAAWTPGSAATDLDGAEVPDEVRQLLEAAALCSDAPATVGPSSGGTEAALVRAAQRQGVDIEKLRRRFPRSGEVPFDAVRRCMRTWHRCSEPSGEDGLQITKGAPEVVLPSLSNESEREAGAAVAQEWAAQGRRVLAVTSTVEGQVVRGGLLALADPVRPEARDAVLACRRAGITPVLVTGDHAATAHSIARATGITDSPVEAGRVNAIPDQERVRARVDPSGKLDLITSWRAAGHVVAMTGDGVNDAPALKAADIGVAMGLRGTDVAKQAADIVLTDDSLATVVAAVTEGRRVFDNIRRFVRYGVAGGLAEVVIMLAGPFVGLALPLLPGQILWVNLLTHGPPGVAIGAEAPESDVGRRPPRPPSEGIVTRTLAAEITLLATAITIACLGVAGWARAGGRPWQSMLFITLALAQLGIAVATRSSTQAVWRMPVSANPMLALAVVVSAALAVAAIYLEPLAAVLHTQPLPPGDLAIAALAATVPAIAFELLKARHRHRRPRP